MNEAENDTPGLVRLSDALGVLLDGCTVCAYDAGDETKIEAAKQMDGATKWAVRCRGEVLGRTGEWEWEPMPSGRDDEFLERCRFATPAEAMECLRNARLNA